MTIGIVSRHIRNIFDLKFSCFSGIFCLSVCPRLETALLDGLETSGRNSKGVALILGSRKTTFLKLFNDC